MVYLFILVFLPSKNTGESGYFLYLGGLTADYRPFSAKIESNFKKNYLK